jgi:hypothetical protein
VAAHGDVGCFFYGAGATIRRSHFPGRRIGPPVGTIRSLVSAQPFGTGAAKLAPEITLHVYRSLTKGLNNVTTDTLFQSKAIEIVLEISGISLVVGVGAGFAFSREPVSRKNGDVILVFATRKGVLNDIVQIGITDLKEATAVVAGVYVDSGPFTGGPGIAAV